MPWLRAFASVALGSATVACSILVSTAGLSGGADPATSNDAEASVDGGGTDGPLADGAVDASFPACDPKKPFVVTPFPAPIKTGSYEFAGSLAPDRLTLYFASDRGGQSEIYVSTRASFAGAWSEPRKLGELGQGSNITIAPDQLSIAFDTQRNGSKDLYRAHRASITAPFDAPAPFLGVNSGQKDDLEPWPSADGKRLYFASDRNGNIDLFVATQVSGDTFQGPTPIGELDTGDDDEDPEVTKDELTIVFGSRRSGGKGGADIWIAHRASTSATWDAPSPIEELNTSADDYASWLSDDGCALIFERVSGDGDLFYAERPP